MNKDNTLLVRVTGHGRPVIADSDGKNIAYSPNEKGEERIQIFEKITTAVNNTYGKGLNPEVMLDVVFMLEQIGYGKFDNKDPYECIFQIKENALKALKNARI